MITTGKIEASTLAPKTLVFHAEGAAILGATQAFLPNKTSKVADMHNIKIVMYILNNAPVTKLFKEIKTQSGYNFVYIEGELKDAKPVSIKVSAGKIDDVLQQIFTSRPLTYTISNNTVVVKENEPPLLASIKSAINSITGKITDEAVKHCPW